MPRYCNCTATFKKDIGCSHCKKPILTNKMTFDIEEFHQTFGLEPIPYDKRDTDFHEYRLGFIREEVDEFDNALTANNKEGMLDALVDLVYVAMGTSYMYGWDFAAAWNRVHYANMQKIRVESASKSKRNSPFDVRKPDGWKAPVLSDLVE